MLETNSNTQPTFKTFQNEIANPAILVIGQRGSGKTTLIKDIIRKKGYDMQKDVYVFCPTDRFYNSYSEHINALNVYYNYESSVVANILKEQQENKRQIVVVFDDCILNAKTQELAELLYNGRHYGISYIWSTQTAINISPDLRLNMDYVFLIGTNTSNLKKIYNHYAGFFPDYSTFVGVYEQLTNDFNCMVIDNRLSVMDVCDKLLTYKANN